MDISLKSFAAKRGTRLSSKKKERKKVQKRRKKRKKMIIKKEKRDENKDSPCSHSFSSPHKERDVF